MLSKTEIIIQSQLHVSPQEIKLSAVFLVSRGYRNEKLQRKYIILLEVSLPGASVLDEASTRNLPENEDLLLSVALRPKFDDENREF
jgi:hypothetical protein